jgi:hypothetical protein
MLIKYRNPILFLQKLHIPLLLFPVKSYELYTDPLSELNRIDIGN